MELDNYKSIWNSILFRMIIIALLLSPILVLAEAPVFEQNTDITLSLPCTINGSYCSASANCYTTILNPDGDVIINNQALNQNGAVWEINLTANQTDINGEYDFNIVCSDRGYSFSRFLNFFITPNGEMPSSSKGILYIGLLVVLLLFFVLAVLGGYRSEHIALKTFLWLFAYLLIIGVCFIAWNLSLDYSTSAPFLTSFFRILFLFLLYALFPIILVSTFFTVYMIIKMNEIQKMINKGVPEDEAYMRTVKGGMRRLFK